MAGRFKNYIFILYTFIESLTLITFTPKLEIYEVDTFNKQKRVIFLLFKSMILDKTEKNEAREVPANLASDGIK